MRIELDRYSNAHSSRNKLRRLAWDVAWACLARPTPRWALNGWRCMLLRLFGARVGKNVRIYGSSRIWQPWRLKIGDNCWIAGDVYLYSVADINIADNVVISEGSFICTASHDISKSNFELVTKPITVEDGVWICARSTILPGICIGEGAVVSAGSVVAIDLVIDSFKFFKK